MLRDETIQRVLKFRDDRDWRQFHTPKDLAISMNLEAAELLRELADDMLQGCPMERFGGLFDDDWDHKYVQGLPLS